VPSPWPSRATTARTTEPVELWSLFIRPTRVLQAEYEYFSPGGPGFLLENPREAACARSATPCGTS
jgi:hypothetical protein